MSNRIPVAILVCIVAAWWAPVAAAEVTLEPVDGKIRVEIDGKLFTEYCYRGFSKPILYPVYGPNGARMTRHYPMRDVVGEEHDHPHQKSMWFTHGDVNGIDFWLEGDDCGKIVHRELLKRSALGDKGEILARNEWRSSKGEPVCEDQTRITFHKLPAGWAIDMQVTILASHGPVTFGDTKEGTMGLRLHPNLRLENEPPHVTTAVGRALNSEGDRGKEVWGKRAKWVDYWGQIDDKTVGVAIFDHPSNLRHPTWWHARQYGLFAANPFGVHDFEGKPKGEGDYHIEEGESATFLYRILFHEGDAESVNVESAYQAFAGE